MASVTLAPYCIDWPRQFQRGRAGLRALFADTDVTVEHIGSTAIPGMVAKPVIDVLLGADTLAVIESRIAALADAGYQYISRYEQQLPTRRYFVKPAAGGDLRVHLHGVVLGSPIWRQHIAFRDALLSDAVLRRDYQSLKVDLATRFAHDKAANTQAKDPFLQAFFASRKLAGA